jgi:membrane protease YdiL (CAAX protease family)
LGFSDIGVFALGLHAIGMALAVFLLARKLRLKNIGWEKIGLSGGIGQKAALFILAFLAIDIGLYTLLSNVFDTIGLPMFWGESNDFKLVSSLDFVAAIAGTVLIAPIAEEIIFRGFVLRAFLDNGYKLATAVGLASLIFSSIHVFFGPGILIFTLLWALFPTFLYLKFKSLYPAIAFHIVNNLLSYILLPAVGFW